MGGYSKWIVTAVSCATILLVAWLQPARQPAYLPPDPIALPRDPSRPPDFTAIPAGPERKAAFFNYLTPIVDRENTHRQANRARLLPLAAGQILNSDADWLKRLARQYDLPAGLADTILVSALLEHVDTIPSSLVLAQAAKESAWGTSRFAIDGNNYFGQRCHHPGCGMVPKNRPADEKFEVQRFRSVQASVASYMFNINRHKEYAQLRAYRAERRRLGKPVTGIQAAERMQQYSERRQAYVDEVQTLIHFNKLDRTP